MEEIKSDNKSKKFPQILAAAIGEFIENLCEKKITINAQGIKLLHFQGALEVGSHWEQPWLGHHLLYPT